jgi:hypothetical protein
MSALSRNITLACGHNEALAQLAKDEQTAWCSVCEARVEVTVHPDAPPPEK